MLWFLAAVVLATSAPAPVTTEDVVQAALQNAPLLAEARGELQAAQGDGRASGGIQHNPELQVGVLFGDPQATGGPKVEGQLMLPIPVSGEGVAASRSADARVDAARAGLERARLETAARARRALLRVVVADSDLRITEQEMTGATRLREAAQARLDAGDVPELDVQLARLEEAGAIAAWLEAKAEATDARVSLAALTGMPVDVAVGSDPLSAAPVVGDAAGEPRADVRAATSSLESARASVDRERAAGLPPVEIGAFFEAGGGPFVIGPRVTLPIPMRNQNQRGIGDARGDVERAEAVAESVQSRASAEQASAEGDLAAAERAGALLGDEMPGAESALAAVQQGYEGGQFDIGQVLLLRGRIVEGERGWYAARAAMASARIEVALARELPALLGD